jgi:hypothetical protein
MHFRSPFGGLAPKRSQHTHTIRGLRNVGQSRVKKRLKARALAALPCPLWRFL